MTLAGKCHFFSYALFSANVCVSTTPMSLTGEALNLEILFLVKASRLGWRMGCVAESTSLHKSSSDQAALERCRVDILLGDVIALAEIPSN
jgi:hypothetical protein